MTDDGRIDTGRPIVKSSMKRGNKSMVVAVIIIVVLLINIAAMAWYIAANDRQYVTSHATITCQINMTTGSNLSIFYLHFHGDILQGGVQQFEGALNLSQNATFLLTCTWLGDAIQTMEVEAWSPTIGSHSYSIHTEIHPNGAYVYYFDL